jgi:V/A-type H+-transporting ATPase subunit B
MSRTDLVTRRSRDVDGVSGPLLFVDVGGAHLGEIVRIGGPAGDRTGEIIELDGERAVVQVLEDTQGIRPARSQVELSGQVARLGVGRRMLGRTFDGAGRPRDGLPPILAEENRAIGGAALNPIRRERPSDFIETGISAIDGLNTLVRGQKLPIFSGAGLPAPSWRRRSCARRAWPAPSRSPWSSPPWASPSARPTST